jgi:hypothetical protein
VVELLPYGLVLLAEVTLVGLDDIHHHFRILLLLILGHTGVAQHSLPVFRQALEIVSECSAFGETSYRELASLVVVAHMYHMHRVLRRRDLDCSRRT